MRELEQSSRLQAASPHSPPPARRAADEETRKRHSDPSPLFPLSSHPSFLDCRLCQDGVHTPTTHRRPSRRYEADEEEDKESHIQRRRARHMRRSLSPPMLPDCSPPASPHHQRLPLPLPSHSLPASPSPSPAVLAALSTLQAKVSDLRLHNRLLTSQLAAERDDSTAKLEDIEAKSRLIIQTLQDRLAAKDEEEGRRRERWVREREGWERGVQERETKLAAMRDRMAQWERQVAVVNVEMRQMGDAIRQRDQKAEEEKRKREAEWEDERRSWKKRDAEREDEQLDMQRGMKRLVDEMRDMNEELNRKDEQERRQRAAVSRLVGMNKEWTRMRNERRGVLDGHVLQCVKKQQELLTELGLTRRRLAAGEEEKETEDGDGRAVDTETGDSDRGRLSRRASTARRTHHSDPTRALTHSRSTGRRKSATHKSAVREKGAPQQLPFPARPASSTAIWPPSAQSTAAYARISRPQSATGFTASSSYHAYDSTGSAEMYHGAHDSRVKPRLPAAFAAQRSGELMKDYRSMFTPQ